MQESRDNENQLDSRQTTFMYHILLTFTLHASQISTHTFFPHVRLGYMMAQLVETMHYKPKGHGFDS